MPQAAVSELLWPTSLACHDLTLSTNVENLALDEALLGAVEADPRTACLRFWEPASYFVVLGRSNRVETEVNFQGCLAAGIPILRRATGGGTVLVGPGCLCYSLVFPLTDLHRSMGISQVTAALMLRTASGLRGLLPDVDVNGTSDLVHHGLKFSGNAQRWLRTSFIHHGTLLFDFDVSLVQRYLAHPTREPAYRQSRSHTEFVANINLNRDQLKSCLRAAWHASDAPCSAAVFEESSKIAVSRYQSAEWLISPRK